MTRRSPCIFTTARQGRRQGTPATDELTNNISRAAMLPVYRVTEDVILDLGYQHQKTPCAVSPVAAQCKTKSLSQDAADAAKGMLLACSMANKQMAMLQLFENTYEGLQVMRKSGQPRRGQEVMHFYTIKKSSIHTQDLCNACLGTRNYAPCFAFSCRNRV